MNKPIVHVMLVSLMLPFFLSTPATADRVLPVPLVAQQHSEWCWAGSAQAVLDYFATPVEQCVMANFAWGREDCCDETVFDWDHACNQPNWMYGPDGSLLHILVNWGVDNSPLESHLAMDDIAREVNAGRPFVIRYGWKEGGGHFTVGHGMEGSLVSVMDPWPDIGHEIRDYDNLVSSPRHDWTHTLRLRSLVLAHSGATDCYDRSGQVIACPAANEPFHGQDGNHAGHAAPLLFFDLGGTVLDLNTGLTWQQDDGGTDRTWTDAVDHCAVLKLGGRSDWRLPSRYELLSITSYDGSNNALSPAFQGAARKYWTGTESIDQADVYAWYVDHGNGGDAKVIAKESPLRARCVAENPISADLLVSRNEVLEDAATGLTWQRGDSGEVLDWENALAYCDTLSLDRRSDWRVPSLRELHSIVDDTRQGPALSPLFSRPQVPTPARAAYWSGTTEVVQPSHAWAVDWYYGTTKRQAKTEPDNLIVRCVRGFGDMTDRHHLDVEVDGQGSVTSNPRGVDCPGACSLRFLPRNTPVVLTTKADANSAFVHWSSGDTVVSVDRAYAFAVTSERRLKARFANIPENFFIVSAAPSHPSTGGTVSDFRTVQGGQSVTMTATAKPGWMFVNWTEDGTEISTSQEFRIEDVRSHRYLTANFRRLQPFPDTGQTRCYDAAGTISCPQPGQPFYGQDVQYQPRQPRSYTKLGQDEAELPITATQDDGWIMTRDNITGLIWQIKTRETTEDTYSRSNAEQRFITGLNRNTFGGFDDWRLPTVKELSSLVDHGVPADQARPSVTEVWFPHTMFLEGYPARYWADEDYRGDPGYFGLGVALSGSGSSEYGGHTIEISKSPTSHAFVYAVRQEQPARPSLIDNGNGTVTDPSTGLIWQKETSSPPRSWQEALSYAEILSLAGFSDWRLPNINELQSLAEYDRNSPAISPVLAGHTFFDHPYWSSTSVASGGDEAQHAKTVTFEYGFAGNNAKKEKLHVRAVRSGASIPVGRLKVFIEPDVAREADMQWRSWPESASPQIEGVGRSHWAVTAQPLGMPEWHDSGADVRVAAGAHRITFSDFPDWNKPADIVVTVDEGRTVERVGTYTRTWDVTVTANDGGVVVPRDTVKVDHGKSLSISVVPDKGNMATVEGDCGGALADEVYTTEPILQDCEVVVEFAPIPPIPTLTEWGLIILALTLLTFGAAALRRSGGVI